MISYVGDHLVKDRDFALTLGEKYQFIMVDEYQDTNNAQNRIIDAILDGAESKNCFVVGDDDQSIYRFQGANLANMFHFSRKYADTRVIVLRENYRSTQPIIDLATQSINFNE
jgi:DNA helicase-2/ATP-dependent DNA helicase PcrA